VIVAVIAIGTAVWMTTSAQSGDPDFNARVETPTFKTNGPKVLIDEGHYNVHTATGRFKPFADLVRNDGYVIESHKGTIAAGSLRGTRILVIANALGSRGLVQQIGNVLGLEGRINLVQTAFTDEEILVITRWVSSGGSLLLIADHAPAGQAVAGLSSKFGVEMSLGYIEDMANADPKLQNPGFLVFSRENGLLMDHPVTTHINKVVTFTGQGLKIPPGGVGFLKLADTAKNYPTRRSADFRSADGMAQGVALMYGQGRVVVLGEAAMLTSQIAGSGDQELKFGMGREDIDNRQLCLNIVHWLSRVL
jgi:hypothetical protein